MSSEASLLKLFIHSVVRKKEILGHGAYGSVEVVLWHGVEYAAKRLRTDVRGQDKDKFYQRFRSEYELLSSLSHKNIIEYRGLCYPSHSDLGDVPSLMMERLKIDLHTRLLDEYSSPLTLKEKVSILLDVAEGLKYLHTHQPQVIHGDLTATNVLLDEKGTAKIGDFGNARMLSYDQSSCLETTTGYLGTPSYTAPEVFPIHALQSFNAKIDSFSFGHLALFVMIDEFPFKLYPSVEMKPDGTKEALSEIERRKEYIEKLKTVCESSNISPMVTLVTNCLDNRPKQRPLATDLVIRLTSLS